MQVKCDCRNSLDSEVKNQISLYCKAAVSERSKLSREFIIHLHSEYSPELANIGSFDFDYHCGLLENLISENTSQLETIEKLEDREQKRNGSFEKLTLVLNKVLPYIFNLTSFGLGLIGAGLGFATQSIDLIAVLAWGIKKIPQCDDFPYTQSSHILNICVGLILILLGLYFIIVHGFRKLTDHAKSRKSNSPSSLD